MNSTAISLTDTVKSNTKEILITAERTYNTPLSKVFPTDRIKFNIRESYPNTTMGELLANKTGLYVRNYGGLGSLQTLSIRGGSAAEAAILLDGFKLNSAQNGIVDIGLLPTGIFSDAVIIRGGASAIYGSNATNGALSLKSKDIILNYSNIAFSAGSFGEVGASTINHFVLDNWNLSINYTKSKAEGNFDFDYNNFGESVTLKRENSYFLKDAFSTKVERKGENNKISLLTLLRQSDRGAPGAVVQNNVLNSNAKLKDWEIINLIRYDHVFDDNNFFVGVLNKVSKYEYQGIQIGNIFSDNSFSSNDISVQSGTSFKIKELSTTAFLESSFSELRGDMLDISQSGYVRRLGIAFSINSELEISKNILLYGATRIDYFNEFKPGYTPTIGLSYKYDNSTFKVSYYQSFRLPSFNEMYYLNFGNTNLKPETSKGVNLVYNYANENIWINDIELVLFAQNTKNKIVSIPRGLLGFTASNFSEVVSVGVESKITSNTKYGNIISRIAWQSIENDNLPLPYFPAKSITLNSQFEPISDLQIDFTFAYNADRYYASNSEAILPDYNTLDVGISYKFCQFNTRLEAFNLIGESYEIILGFPMPKQQFRLSIAYDIYKED